MKRILLIFLIFILISAITMFLILRPKVILKQVVEIKNSSYIQVVETAGGDWITALLGLDTPSYILEYRSSDDCILSSTSFEIEYYKVSDSKIILTNDNVYIVVFDGMIIGRLQNGIWAEH